MTAPVEINSDQRLALVSAAFEGAPLHILKQGQFLNASAAVLRLEKGCAGRVQRLADGRTQILGLFIAGDLLGLREQFGLAAGGEIECLSSRAEVRSRATETLKQMVGEETLDRAARQRTVDDERINADRLVALGRGMSDERYAGFLLEMRERMLRSGKLAEPGLEFDIPLTQEQLGDYLGLSTVHVNRTVKKLASRAIATREGWRVRIQNLDALTGLASAILKAVPRRPAIAS